jgi:hypothetical protein
MRTQFLFIHFECEDSNGTRPGAKTHRWSIQNNRTGDVLGQVRWNGAWRSYCFYPVPETVWSGGCLEDVSTFIRQATDEHHQRRAASCSGS